MGEDERDVLFFSQYYGRSEEIHLREQLSEEKWKMGIFIVTVIVYTAFIIYDIFFGKIEINFINLLCLIFCDILFVINAIVARSKMKHYSQRLKEL